jgi:hypothetical protein
MSFASKIYGVLRGAALPLGLAIVAPAAAQPPPLTPPATARGFYVPAPANVPIANGTGILVFLAWNGTPAESSAGFRGFRVRRTIHGVSNTPLEVVGQWLTVIDTPRGPVPVPISSLCFDLSQPCDLQDFVFTGTGIFFKGFRNNALPGGRYVIDYPPGAPQNNCDTCWLYADLASLAGFRHDYVVTTIGAFDLTDYEETPIAQSEQVALEPATPPADNLERVAVVPNPYRGRAEWDPSGSEGRIHFIHLPAGATVRIFTSNAELVRELKLDSTANPGGTTGELEWDLRNGKGNKVVSGIYIYQAETPEGRSRKGHFVIIK